ncbi:MAG: phosphoribosylformylglycinamidine synthase, partial [Oscillospiraceae bacterium]|nr:phosphoribosylformylglycinamidine synthase [Oscillospiraceae bacterium]
MNEVLVGNITHELTQDVGIAAEFLTYMALLRLPPPCRVLFNYKMMAEEIALAEIDMLAITHGGLMVVEVKHQLNQSGEIIRHNKDRIRLLRERLGLGKKSLPMHSIVVFHNERQDKWVWAQDQTIFVHVRYLLTVVNWLAAQRPQALSETRVNELCRQLSDLKHNPAPKARPKPRPQKINTKPKKESTSMVHRIYTGRREGFDLEAQALLREWRTQLGVQGLQRVEVFNRYDVQGIDEALFARCIPTVFSEPQTDVTMPLLPNTQGAHVFATEFLPGQYDQRADSAAQCAAIVGGGTRPQVRTAKVFVLHGTLTDDELARVKKATINPVECREARFEKPESLDLVVDLPDSVEVLAGFTKLDDAGLAAFLKQRGLAMDLDDLRFCQAYFVRENRDPTVTEIRMIDTYWSDHCRHTTFLTHLNDITIDDPRAAKTYELFLQNKRELGREHKPTTLMEVATQAMRYLRKTGKLDRLDESDEINACTVKTEIDIDGKPEPWLFLFKNETHNHPTEIEPFGGAATCIGGAIRDPLSGRGYVFQAMRISGAADPTVPIEQTLPGKLPQRKLVTTAANGYSSYGNQIGLATGLVEEIYHPGYAAKRLELGAVVGAVPQAQVRREVPAPGDKVILLGGRTGRDGCGGATGSSKSHTLDSLEECGAEVQKGNAPEERKLMRLFRNPAAAKMIKRCNDFGAGGVSVAIGELCDGLRINLDAVPLKYDGLDGTEIAISESQERMAIVVEADDVAGFIALAEQENLEANVVAEVQAEPRLQMTWKGKQIVDLAREFLNSNGATKTAAAHVTMRNAQCVMRNEDLRELAANLNMASQKGLVERFDSTIGAGSVFMPFGGKYQATPAQVMAAKFPVRHGETHAASVMSYGYDPYLTEADPYKGAYCAVVESVTKLAAAGCPLDECYLSFQEYFQRMTDDPAIWGKPLAALLGALQAQLDLGLASIGGKDSMSGTFEQLHVPPTLVSFAVGLADWRNLVSNEFKQVGSQLVLAAPPCDEHGLPMPKHMLEMFAQIAELAADGKVLAAHAVTSSGVAGAVLNMSLGNRIGAKVDCDNQFAYIPGGIVLELAEGVQFGMVIGETTEEYAINGVCGKALEALYDNKLEAVFPTQVEQGDTAVKAIDFTRRSGAAPAIKTAKPRVLIPVFPGTNCEYDTARAFERAGAETEILVVNNMTPQGLADSVQRMAKSLEAAQVLFIPGGFSGGDEPDGSGKFITAFLRNAQLTEGVTRLLDDRMGLVGGICNGFQALIKLGLVPFGKITDMTAECPTLTFNAIGRHQSKLVRTRVSSVLSPWLALCEPGEVHLNPISHGEGRFVCPPQ